MPSDQFQIVGKTIAGNYEVKAVVAEGGFAVVYRALHKGFDAPVALKCLKLSSTLAKDRQEQFLAQFKSEAALLFQLSARIPTVVRPLHIDALTTSTGAFVPYMVLEWLEGETLAAVNQQRSADGRAAPPLKKIVRLLTPVARALERAHNFTSSAGQPVSIVHCDIKPENIFVASEGGEQVVKILDFGVARAQSVASQVAGTQGQKSTAGSFTPAFAAPEQWAPDKFGGTGPWTDVFSLALVLVETMAGRSIIEGDLGAMMGLALDPLARPTPRNNELDVPDAVEEVFEHALALRPQDRYAHAGLFWEDLEVALGLKQGRPRDARREVGTMLREERIEVGKPKMVRRIKKLVLQGAPAARKTPPRERLTIEDPFEKEDSGLFALDAPGVAFGESMGGLEAAIPSFPPDARAPRAPAPMASLEAAIPSVPPEPVLGGSLEAMLDSVPPLAAALPAAPAVQPPRPPELAMPAARPSAPSASELDLPERASAGDFGAFELEAPIASRPSASERRASEPARVRDPNSGDLEIHDDGPALRVDLRSELPPRPVAAAPMVAMRRPGMPRIDVPVEPRRSESSLWKTGVGLVVVAIVIGVAGSFFRDEEGVSKLAVGPVSPTLVAGVLLAAGVALLVYGLLPKDR